MEDEMQTNNHILLTRVILCGLMILAVFLVAFGVKSLLSARAQGNPAKTPTGAVVSLSADKAFFDSTEPVILHVTITNPNDTSIRVLKWFTPTEGVTEPLFTITLAGEPVAYLGIMLKRSAPTEQDYITLAPGESLSSDVSLSAYYDLSVSGNYEVRYNVTSIQLYMQDNNNHLNRSDHLTSNILSMFINGRAAPAPSMISP
jgi:peptidyl-Lys metalloendopeptidase